MDSEFYNSIYRLYLKGDIVNYTIRLNKLSKLELVNFINKVGFSSEFDDPVDMVIVHVALYLNRKNKNKK